MTSWLRYFARIFATCSSPRAPSAQAFSCVGSSLIASSAPPMRGCFSRTRFSRFASRRSCSRRALAPAVPRWNSSEGPPAELIPQTNGAHGPVLEQRVLLAIAGRSAAAWRSTRPSRRTWSTLPRMRSTPRATAAVSSRTNCALLLSPVRASAVEPVLRTSVQDERRARCRARPGRPHRWTKRARVAAAWTPPGRPTRASSQRRRDARTSCNAALSGGGRSCAGRAQPAACSVPLVSPEPRPLVYSATEVAKPSDPDPGGRSSCSFTS